MSVLNYAKKLAGVTGETEAEIKAALSTYMDSVGGILENDVQERLYGVKNTRGTGYVRAGYVQLRKFFEGDQWTMTKEDGASMRVYNHCRPIVLNYTAFLSNEEPEVDIPPRDPKDDVEVARVKEVENLVKEILDDNNFGSEFEKSTMNGSLLGDSMIIGPFWDAEKKRIWFKNVKRPENVSIIWSSSDYETMLAYVIKYRLTLEEATNLYGEVSESLGVALAGSVEEQRAGDARQGERQYVEVLQFCDDRFTVTKIGGKVVELVEHNWGFVSLIYVPNTPHPTLPYGISDLEDVLDPQQEYNESAAEQRDILKQVAYPAIFGANLQVEEVIAGVAKIYDLGDEAKVFPDPRNTNFPFLANYLQGRRNDISSTSGLNDIFTGSSENVFKSTGRALSVLMQPVTNRVKARQRRWRKALRTLVGNTLRLVEIYVDGGKALVDGHYDCDIFFPGTLIRNVTEELNKMNLKVQSQYTTMKNIGIASPKDEQEMMKKEYSDDSLVIELSRSPQLHLALKQQMEAKKQENRGGKNKSTAPQLSEGENSPGEAPTSAPGVPSAAPVPAGALAALAGGLEE